MLFAGRDLGDETTSEYVIDITKQTEAALRESEERLSACEWKTVREYAPFQTDT
jgi:hypothetical protein